MLSTANIKDDELELEAASLAGLKASNVPVILAVNKIDTVQKLRLLPILDKLKGIYDFSDIVPISAKNDENLDELFEKLKEFLPEGPKFFPDDTITDQPERQIVAEYIREGSAPFKPRGSSRDCGRDRKDETSR